MDSPFSTVTQSITETAKVGMINLFENKNVWHKYALKQ